VVSTTVPVGVTAGTGAGSAGAVVDVAGGAAGLAGFRAAVVMGAQPVTAMATSATSARPSLP
jgi:hypothetical protein